MYKTPSFLSAGWNVLNLNLSPNILIYKGMCALFLQNNSFKVPIKPSYDAAFKQELRRKILPFVCSHQRDL